MRASHLAAAFFVCILGAPCAHAQATGPFVLPAERLTLSNGLTLLLAPDPHARLVSVLVSYGVGMADEPDGLRGLAHLVEHLVASGARHAPHALQQLEAAGSCHVNAVTSLDTTVYFESVPPERVETALWVESDRMGYAADAVTEQRVDAERAIVANENRDMDLDAPLANVGPFVGAEIYPAWHPYAKSLADDSDLRGIRAKDVAAFLHTWYSPSNATLAIAGAFDREATLAAVNRYFGGIAPMAVPTRPALPDWTTTPVTLTIAAAVPSDIVQLFWRTPAYGTRDDAALDVVASALAGPGNTRLGSALVSAGLATSVSARQVSDRDASVFYIEARVAPGEAPVTVVAMIQRVIDDLAGAATAGEVERARSTWRNGSLQRLETTWGRAATLVSLQRIGAEIGPDFDWGLGRYASFSPDAVARAAGSWLTRARRITTVVYANRWAPGRGRLLRREEGVR
jgi:predicted Zn-dependent peptidase